MCVAYCLLCKQSIPQPDKPAAPFTQRGHRSLSIPTFLYYQILRCKIPFIPHSTFLISHWAKPIHSPFHIRLLRRQTTSPPPSVVPLSLHRRGDCSLSVLSILYNRILHRKIPDITHYSLLIVAKQPFIANC